MLDFPNSPVTGQTFTSGSIGWIFDGVKWSVLVSDGGGGSGTGIPDAPADNVAYGRENLAWVPVLALTGDILDGGNY